MAKYLDYSGLSDLWVKIKAKIPTKVSDLTNDSGFVTSSGVTSVRVQATSPVASSTSTAQTSTLNTTISLSDAYGDTKNPYGNKNANLVLASPSSGNAAAPSFRSLVAADIPALAWSKITSGKPTTLSGYGITDASISNGVITLGSNTITPLTSHQTMYEANLVWGGKNFSASYGCLDAAMVDVLGANRFAFLKAAGLTIEYSTDAGSTWTDYGATDV